MATYTSRTAKFTKDGDTFIIDPIAKMVKKDITDLGIPGQDTTYESKTAASGGTDVSLVTTGEKYTWNNKVNSNQGSENAGKALGINNQGEVVPVPFSGEDFTGATALTDGVHGYVPAPDAGEEGKFLKGNGTWDDVPDPQVMTGATSSAAGTSGLVPAPAAGKNVFFLKGDGTWDLPEGSKLIEKTLDAVTNESGSYTHTTTLSDVAADMKVIMIELSNPKAFRDTIYFSPADGSVTLSCNNVVGTSTVKVTMTFVAGANKITSSEFDVLNNRLDEIENVCAEVDISIGTSDWTEANGMYSFVYSNALIKAKSLVEVFLRDGSENSGIDDFEYVKSTGSVTFATSSQPTGNLPLTIRIMHTKNTNAQNLTASEISSEAISGAFNVEAALTALSTNKVATADIADNLTTDDATKVLSAKQGKLLNSHLGTLITTEEKTIIVGTNVTVSSRNGYYYGEYALSNFSDSTKIIAAQVVTWSGTVGTCIIDGTNLCVLYNANPSNGHYLKVRAIKLNV